MRLSTMINLNESNIFLKHLFYSIKNYTIPQNIPSELKDKIIDISLEARLYSQVLMIKHQTEVNYIKEVSNDKNETYIKPKKLQVQF